MKKLLIVSDGKAGHENQSKAFCQAMGYAYDCVQARYPWRIHKALSFLADRVNIHTPRLFKMEEVPPDNFYAAVVCTGSGAFYPGKVTARRLGAPVAAILYPGGYRLSTFDCIMVPGFDRPPQDPNIVRIPMNLTAVDTAFYEGAVEAFRRRYPAAAPDCTREHPTALDCSRPPSPAPDGGGAVGVIIGGPTRFAPMTPESLGGALDAIFKLTEGGRWVTTSRRTPPWADAIIDRYPFDYKLIYSRDNTFNPVPAFVTLCERLFVTADSSGMISEAVSSGGAMVEVLGTPPIKEGGGKFARFLKGLAEGGAVHLFDGTLGTANKKIDLSPVFEKARQLLRL